MAGSPCAGRDARVETAAPSVSLDASAADALLRDPASASVPYLLTLVQPLTAREIRDHPLRRQYVALWGAPDLADPPATLKAGVRAGLLVPLPGEEGATHFFLNSDVALGLPPLTEEDEGAGSLAERAGALRVEDVCLPRGSSLGTDHPVPRFEDPSTFFGWYLCLARPAWREALRLLQERGTRSRRDLGQEGAPLAEEEVEGAVRCGVLRLEEGRLGFPFAGTELPPGGRGWTARPPVAWLSRSLEPLGCVEEAEAYLAEGGERSPMELLRAMAEDGRRVRPRWRRPHLTVNLLYRPSGVLPRIETLGPGSLPSIWENRKGVVHAVREGFPRAAVALRLREELAGTETGSWRDDALDELASHRVRRYLEAREAAVTARLGEGRPSEYGLGSGAIASLAEVELERDKLAAERKHFERFLEVLRGEGQAE